MHVGNGATDPSGRFAVLVIVDGRPLPVYRRPADGKQFVAGIPGSRYILRVENLTTGRLEVVASVDQRDTLTDKPASVSNGGMCVPPRGSTSFDGWRQNDDTVGAFVFGEPNRSVSAQATGDTSGVGIIGFAAFTEQRYEPVYRSPLTFDTADSPLESYGGAKSVGRGSLGTGIGEEVTSHVTRVHFRRSAEPPAILEIGYDTLKWLTEQGIVGPAKPAEPLAFPKHNAFGGYEQM